MRINLADIGNEPLYIKGEDSAEVLGLEDDASLHAAGPLMYDLSADLVSSQLIVRGWIGAAVSFRCGRCANWYEADVGVDDFLVAVEVGEEDELVDLTSEMREAIILAFPDFPLCRESCKGLCPQCGADLNEGKCGCRPPVINHWEALDGLGLEKE